MLTVFYHPVPAGAGLNRTPTAWTTGSSTGPRRRGAQPIELRRLLGRHHRSPQARGSTVLGGISDSIEQPVPAGAGLNRGRGAIWKWPGTGPRRRGAQPRRDSLSPFCDIRSPQARGSTVPLAAGRHPAHRSPQARGSTARAGGADARWPPVPAGAGLNRRFRLVRRDRRPGPRRRGAQPAMSCSFTTRISRSPQARGSTARQVLLPERALPVPAGAGLNRTTSTRCRTRSTGPRRRGAQPREAASPAETATRSPQARGSTGPGFSLQLHYSPVPAGAGLNRR